MGSDNALNDRCADFVRDRVLFGTACSYEELIPIRAVIFFY